MADWERIKSEYICSDISLRDLANKHGLKRYQTLASRSKKEGWVELREQHRANSVLKACQSVSDDKAADIADHLRMHRSASDNLAKVLEQLSNIDITDENTKLTMKDIRTFAAALKDAVAVQRDLYDLPNVVDMHRMGTDDDRDIIVHFAGSEDNDYGV